MSTLAQSQTVPPFPTRFPPPPRLALARRRWSEDETTSNDAGSSGERPPSEAERLIRQLELALALRERAVSDAESRLAERVRDLDEMEALVRAREALLSAARLRDSGTRGVVTLREAEALHQLKEELDRQEATLREARQALGEREQFMERSETQLFAKVQQQQERETELDQREENLATREARLTFAAAGTPAASPPKRIYDEFRE